MSEFTRIVDIGGNETVVDKHNQPIRKVAYYFGNSTRTRPKKADGAKDGDKLFESDTGFVGMFDEDIDDWVEV